MSGLCIDTYAVQDLVRDYDVRSQIDEIFDYAEEVDQPGETTRVMYMAYKG